MRDVKTLYSIAIDKAIYDKQPFSFYDRQYKILFKTENETPIKYYNTILDNYLFYKSLKFKSEPALKKGLVKGLEALIKDC